MSRSLEELVDESKDLSPAQQRQWFRLLPRSERRTLEIADVYRSDTALEEPEVCCTKSRDIVFMTSRCSRYTNREEY